MIWPSVPLRALYRRVEERNRPDLPPLSVYRDLGVVPREGREDNYNKLSDDLTAYKVVRPGDLVLNKMKTWQGSIGVSDYEGIVSPAYFIGRRIADVDSRFMHHLLRSAPLIAEYGARSKGIRPSQWDLPWDEFTAIRVNVPPLATQRAIADYLDTETAHIDALIEKKRRTIDLLDERNVALAHEAITGVPIAGVRRESSLPWLGDLPSHWRLAPVATQFRVDLGRMLNAERAAVGEMRPYVRNINVRWDIVDVTDLAEMDFPSPERRQYRLLPGDLLINEGGAGVGRSAIWHGELDECYFQKSVLRLRPIGHSCPEWMLECMRVAVGMKVPLVEGNLATIPHVPAEALRVYRFPFPQQDKQNAMLAWLHDERSRDRPLRSATVNQIDLLAERRQALITAAVTGELDVPGVAA